MSHYAVELEQTSSRSIAVVRGQASVGELSQVVPRMCGEVWNFVRSSGLSGAGRNIAVYLDGVMNLEVGVDMARPFQGNGQVVCSTLPAGRVAKTTHIGPYHQLGGAHEALRAWCDDHGQRIAGPSWEIYGHWTDDVSKLRTDVCYLLADCA